MRARFWLALLVLPLISQIASAAEVAWRKDLRQAGIEAQRTGKPILMQVTAEWCGYCHRMIDEVFTQDAVARRINASFIPVLLDADRNPRAVELIGIESFPSTIIISAELNVIGRVEGFHQASAFLTKLAPYGRAQESGTTRVEPTPVDGRPGFATVPQADTKELRSVAKPANSTPAPITVSPITAVTPIPLLPVTPPSSVRRVADTTDADSTNADADESEAGSATGAAEPARLPVGASEEALPALDVPALEKSERDPAFEGLCLVSMVTHRKLVPGKETVEHIHRGTRLWFSSEEHRAEFVASPERYWPLLDGRCPVAAQREETDIAGDPRTTAVYRGRLVMFHSFEHRKAFSQNPRGFMPASDVLANSSETSPR